MTKTLLTLIMPDDVAQHVEDLLLQHPERVPGFTSTATYGHGPAVPLLEASDLVSGHTPRTQIQMLGPETDMRAVLDIIKEELPRAHIFFWLQPVIEAGYL
jgi:hypothetical protein